MRLRQVVQPSEHGSWSLMLMPFVVGAGVALVGPHPSSGLGIALAFVGAMSLFLTRQPLTLYLRFRRAGTLPEDERLALRAALALLALAAAAGAGLIALGRVQVLWLAVPASAILALTLAMGAILGPRRLATELLGAAGLALSAPAAYVAGTGLLNAAAVAVWAISAGYGMLGILYVRLRIGHRLGRATRTEELALVGAHLLALVLAIAAASVGWIPRLAGAPFALILVRAVVIAWRKPRVQNLRRFGYVEVVLAAAFAAIIIVAYALAGSGGA